jgi:hypothetical protein
MKMAKEIMSAAKTDTFRMTFRNTIVVGKMIIAIIIIAIIERFIMASFMTDNELMVSCLCKVLGLRCMFLCLGLNCW